ARKGLADTALKTADSGYLTRRLVDVAQDVIISEHDCGTLDGIEARAIVESGEIIEPLRDRIIGRVTLERLTDPFTGETIVDVNEVMDEDLSSQIQDAGIEKVKIRSVLTCTSRRGVCAQCYGRDRERYPVVYGARLKVKEGETVEQGQVLVEWDPYTFSILTEEAGQVRFKDILEGITVHEEVDEVTGLSRLIIVDSPDEKKQ